MDSHGRKSMKQHAAPALNSGRQMNLIFEPSRIDGMNETERMKVVLTLARILMQAAGISIEELADDKR
ncbi:hypothetical protein AM571_PA00224 (plasmid) [Rhizobium etli 8C-3]|jgi:hypothetical protein|uniref:Uncharacterized protein n=3 Tax=Rhizobium TaxID=379 RepID=A0A1L5PA98_RHIET|nr:hypothetical protein AM571_PA00224 [Rhizobium etli 8C-3]ARM14831.1 hypothetical protein Bra5_PB00079 [Rhizobium phaseoli Brasil 5]ARM15120.1 hypothetical protein Bra5_PB00374 [Rhizobium phaseoli Brasil 5]